MPEFIRSSYSEADNLPIAKEILTIFKEERIFAFYGDLGAGKTTFIKSLCYALGVEDNVSSPTFNLVNEYWAETLGVYHFDFYRIKSEIEAYDIGCDEYFDSGEYCLIEWPEKIPTLLPPDRIDIYIEHLNNENRTIRITY